MLIPQLHSSCWMVCDFNDPVTLSIPNTGRKKVFDKDV